MSSSMSILYFRATNRCHIKAFSAGNIGHISKLDKAEMAPIGSSRRARSPGCLAVLRSLAIFSILPAESRLARQPGEHAETQYTHGGGHL